MRWLSGLMAILCWSRANSACFVLCIVIAIVMISMGNGIKGAAPAACVAILNLILGAMNGLSESKRRD